MFGVVAVLQTCILSGEGCKPYCLLSITSSNAIDHVNPRRTDLLSCSQKLVAIAPPPSLNFSHEKMSPRRPILMLTHPFSPRKMSPRPVLFSVSCRSWSGSTRLLLPLVSLSSHTCDFLLQIFSNYLFSFQKLSAHSHDSPSPPVVTNTISTSPQPVMGGKGLNVMGGKGLNKIIHILSIVTLKISEISF